MRWTMINKLSLLSLFLFLLASCDKEEYDTGTSTGGDSEEIRFEIAVGTATAVPAGETRVTTDLSYNSKFENGDAIGVYIVKGNGGLQSFGNWADNVKLTYNNGTWTPSTSLYYPTDGEQLHFYAYYPYITAVPDALSISIPGLTDQSSAANLSKSDLLAASTLNVEKGPTPVQLNFSHVLAMVELSVTGGGTGARMSSDIVVTLEGCKPDISFNLKTKAAGTSGSVKSVKMYRVEQSGDADYLTKYTYRALAPTQTVLSGEELFRLSQTQGTVTRTLSNKVSGVISIFSRQVRLFKITLQPGLDPNHVYAVGDYYPYKGFPIQGVVFEISNGGKNGKIVDLDFITRYAPVPGNATAPIRWGDPAVDEQAAGVADIRDMNDGYNGTKNLIIKRKDQASFASTYCIFNWIYLTKNNGDVNGMWYLPAVNEMIELHDQLDSLSSIIEAAGGHPLPTDYYFMVLTEKNTTNAYYVNNKLFKSPFTKEEANYSIVTAVIAKF